MKLFFSGTDALGHNLWPKVVPQCPWRLLSVHADYLASAKTWMSYLPEKSDIEIMLDSGAFTAWTKGKMVTLDEVVRAYGEAMETLDGRVKHLWLLNLDFIPGAIGRVPGTEEIDEALRVSDENYERLEHLFPGHMIPVYHMFEPPARLEELIAACPGYLALSPRNDFPENKRLRFAKNVHYAVNGRVKTHGLGATGLRMMTTVPWESVDSIGWLLAGGMGCVQWFEGERLLKVKLSERDTEGPMGNNHYTVIPSSVRDSLQRAAERYGFTVEELRANNRPRKAFNMLAAVDMVRTMQKHALPDQTDMFASELSRAENAAAMALALTTTEGDEVVV